MHDSQNQLKVLLWKICFPSCGVGGSEWSLKINKNQRELILLQNMTNYEKFKFPDWKKN